VGKEREERRQPTTNRLEKEAAGRQEKGCAAPAPPWNVNFTDREGQHLLNWVRRQGGCGLRGRKNTMKKNPEVTREQKREKGRNRNRKKTSQTQTKAK